ncbi:MAG TPA: hypothetical protein VI076_16750 [Actinopolymorphaceae bacterium]
MPGAANLECQEQLYREPETDASDSFAGRPDDRTVPEEGQSFEAERNVGHTAGRRPDDIVVRTWATLTIEAASLEQARGHWVFSVQKLTDLVERPELAPPEPTRWPAPLTKPRSWQEAEMTEGPVTASALRTPTADDARPHVLQGTCGGTVPCGRSSR